MPMLHSTRRKSIARFSHKYLYELCLDAGECGADYIYDGYEVLQYNKIEKASNPSHTKYEKRDNVLIFKDGEFVCHVMLDTGEIVLDHFEEYDGDVEIVRGEPQEHPRFISVPISAEDRALILAAM